MNSLSKKGKLRKLSLGIFALLLIIFLVVASGEENSSALENSTSENDTTTINFSQQILSIETENLTYNQTENVTIEVQSSENIPPSILDISTEEEIPSKLVELSIIPSSFAAEFAARNERGLTAVVAGKNVIHDTYAQEYLNNNNYFSTIAFENLDDIPQKNYAVQVGNLEKVPLGIQKGTQRYVLDVLACSEEARACWMRINGIIFKHVSADTIIQLDASAELRITSIEFNQCGDQQFCDYYYEAYDEITMVLMDSW